MRLRAGAIAAGVTPRRVPHRLLREQNAAPARSALEASMGPPAGRGAAASASRLRHSEYPDSQEVGNGGLRRIMTANAQRPRPSGLLACRGRTRPSCARKDASACQVSTGMAWVFDRYSKASSPLYPLQATAKASGLGLWADPTPVPSWDWRRPPRISQTLRS